MTRVINGKPSCLFFFNKWTKTELYKRYIKLELIIRAKEHPMIQGYFNKPLSKDTLNKIFLEKMV